MSTSNTTVISSGVQKEVTRIFNLQKANQHTVAATTAKERRKKLDRIHKAILRYRPQLKEAMYKDFRKHPSEVDLTEIYPLTSEIKHIRGNLARWMRPKPVDTPMALLGTSSYIHYEPKGVVLIVSPWNFPVNLTFGPLLAAVAAGNCVMLKPSEHTPFTSAVMKSIISELFDESEIALIEGAIETSTALLELPFNHIFFTGAPEIGKIVMTAAAKHLTSVTLELGGKSPTIVDKTANLDKAALRVAWAKWMNNGQICIAPDYLFVHEEVKDQFLEKMQANLKIFYGENAAQHESYARIVNGKHFNRIKGYIDDALEKGAKIEFGGTTDETQDFIEPTVVTGAPQDSDLMQKEIFGPVLPVSTFKNIQEPIDLINGKERPLALYIYSKSKKNIKQVINRTRAGGTCINNSVIHYSNVDLPFGGVNNSGIGKANGIYGFEAFSNARGVLKQWSPFNAIDLMMPPYTSFKQKLIDFSVKWF